MPGDLFMFVPKLRTMRWQKPGLTLLLLGLEKRSLPKGTIVIAKRELEWQGRRYRVGFTKHAADRCVTRCTAGYSWDSLGDAGGLLGIFSQRFALTRLTTWVERLTDDVPKGVVLWELATNKELGGPFLSDRMIEALLGRKSREDEGLRVAYGPTELEGDILVVKTLLRPGYHNTPEFARMRRRGWDSKDLQDAAELMDWGKDYAGNSMASTIS